MSEGPHWVEIDSCKARIEEEKRWIKWAKERLVEGSTPLAEALYREFLEDAQSLLSQAEGELAYWQKKKFEDIRDTA